MTLKEKMFQMLLAELVVTTCDMIAQKFLPRSSANVSPCTPEHI